MSLHQLINSWFASLGLPYIIFPLELTLFITLLNAVENAADCEV